MLDYKSETTIIMTSYLHLILHVYFNHLPHLLTYGIIVAELHNKIPMFRGTKT